MGSQSLFIVLLRFYLEKDYYYFFSDNTLDFLMGILVNFTLYFIFQPMFSVAPSLATNASAAFNPYLGPVSPSLVPAEILPTAPMLVTGNPGVPVPAAAAAAAQKLMRTDRLEVGVMGIFMYSILKFIVCSLFFYFFSGYKG